MINFKVMICLKWGWNNSYPSNLSILLISFLCFFFGSCKIQKIYPPALYQSDISYLPKPSLADSIHSQSYLSGGYGSVIGNNSSYQINLYQFDASRAWVFKDFNLAIGAFADLGNIQNTVNNPDSINRKDPYYFDYKGFSVSGARLSMNFFETDGHFNFRILGFEASYSHEDGDYLAYRKQIINVPNYFTSTQNNLFTLGGTTEIIIVGEKNPYNKIGLRIFVGQTFGNLNYLNGYYQGRHRS